MHAIGVSMNDQGGHVNPRKVVAKVGLPAGEALAHPCRGRGDGLDPVCLQALRAHQIAAQRVEVAGSFEEVSEKCGPVMHQRGTHVVEHGAVKVRRIAVALAEIEVVDRPQVVAERAVVAA